MNDVDLADQVLNVYQWDLFMRKRKWWWSIRMWCLQILQANAYAFYIKYMTINHLNAISHFEVNIKICLAWIDPERYWPQKKHGHQYQSRSGDITSRTAQSTTTASVDFINRSPRITDKSLCPLYDNLRMHLQESEPHWPVPSFKKCELSVALLGDGHRQEDAR